MKRTALLLFLLAGFYLVSYRGVVFAPGHVYQNWDNGLPPYPTQVARYGDVSQFVWNAAFEMGSPNPMGGMNRWFDRVVRIGLSPLGGAVIGKWHALAYVLAGGAGMALLCRVLGLGFFASLAACLLYAFNPRMYSLAVSGHLLEVGFALALIPWAALCLLTAGKAVTRRGRAACVLAAGLLGGLICSASPFGLIFFGVFLSLFAAALAWSGKSLRPLVHFVLAGLVVVVLHLYWLVPTAAQLTSGTSAIKYNQDADGLRDNYRHMYADFSVPPANAMIGHTDNYGMGTEYAYPVSTQDTPFWKASAYALLLLAVLGLAFRAKSPGVKRFAVLCLLFGFSLMAGKYVLGGRYFYEIILSRVQMIFFLMARPARWLPVFFTGFALLAGMGVQTLLDRPFRETAPERSRRIDALIYAVCLGLLAVYLWPYLNGSISEPKTATTQTMALMPQKPYPPEEALAGRLTADPEDYRVTVWPTINSPTGDVPAPPKTSLTRNFGMMGKDAVIGPSFIGQPFTSYLLGLMHRPWPYTDMFGRLMGLAAVKRVLFDSRESYLSYSGYGWMPTTKRGPETLFDPLGIIGPFAEAQKDLAPEDKAAWDYGDIDILRNRDFLPRARWVPEALLSTGGFPGLQTLAELPDDLFARAALFPAATTGRADLGRLGGRLTGLAGEASGALDAGENLEWLFPYLADPDTGRVSGFATAAGEGKTPEGFVPLAKRPGRYPRLEGGALEYGALLAESPGTIRFALPGVSTARGSGRLFLRYARLPGAAGLRAFVNGRERFADTDEVLYDRGPRFADLGPAPTAGGDLTVKAEGYGVLASGALTVAPEALDAAREAFLDGPGRGGVLAAVEAESAAGPGAMFSAKVYAPERAFPLLAVRAGINVQSAGARVERAGALGQGLGDGLVAVEGTQPGEALFIVSFGRMMEQFTLTTYPRLFGDPDRESYVEASYSLDGRVYAPLYRVAGEKDNRWEDVYGRKMVNLIAGRTDKIHLRFRMLQAQLSSQANRPNSPMELVASPAGAPPGTASFGQGVFLPADFAFKAPRPGTYRLSVRALGRRGDAVSLAGGPSATLAEDGAQWLDFGPVETDAKGGLAPAFTASDGVVCDILALRAPCLDGTAPSGSADPDGGLTVSRVNSGLYEAALDGAKGGLLLFAEAYNPLWRMSLSGADREEGKDEAPMAAYGFMNAWPLPEEGAAEARIHFLLQDIQDRFLPVSEAGWLAGLAVLALLSGSLLFGGGRRKEREAPEG